MEKATGGRGYDAFAKALASAALFGIATPFSKTLLGGLQENQLAGLLYLGAAAFLFPFMVKERFTGSSSFPRDRRNRLLLLGAVLFGGVIGPVLLLMGLRIATAASVSMWLNLETVATAVLAFALFREHLGKWTWAGNAGVLLAGILLTLSEGRPGLAAILCVGGAAIAWGLDNNFTAMIDGITPEASTFWKGLVAGSVNLAIGAALAGSHVSPLWLGALVLGGISYGASISLYIASAQELGAARSQMIFAWAPFFGVLTSVVWLGEGMSLLQILGGILLAASVFLLLVDQHGHEHVHHALEHQHAHRHDDGHHLHAHSGEPNGLRHSHTHAHEPVRHSHPHWPDLHHRHEHGE